MSPLSPFWLRGRGVEDGNRLGDGHVAGGGVVKVVQKEGDLVFGEVCQQTKDLVDRGPRPVVRFGGHLGRVWWGEKRDNEKNGLRTGSITKL